MEERCSGGQHTSRSGGSGTEWFCVGGARRGCGVGVHHAKSVLPCKDVVLKKKKKKDVVLVSSRSLRTLPWKMLKTGKDRAPGHPTDPH